MTLSTFQIRSPRRREEGLRIGVVRYPPRGVRKADYARLGLFDVWLPTLVPSQALLRRYKGKEWVAGVRDSFFRKYRSELLANTDAKQTILLLARLSRRTDISLGCTCEDERYCHRSVLYDLIRRERDRRQPRSSRKSGKTRPKRRLG
jgi:uncharacterized protein YeaO (DUF488 family)